MSEKCRLSKQERDQPAASVRIGGLDDRDIDRLLATGREAECRSGLLDQPSDDPLVDLRVERSSAVVDEVRSDSPLGEQGRLEDLRCRADETRLDLLVDLERERRAELTNESRCDGEPSGRSEGGTELADKTDDDGLIDIGTEGRSVRCDQPWSDRLIDVGAERRGRVADDPDDDALVDVRTERCSRCIDERNVDVLIGDRRRTKSWTLLGMSARATAWLTFGV